MNNAYETKCYELAEAFLVDHPKINCDEVLAELAYHILGAAEQAIDYVYERKGLEK